MLTGKKFPVNVSALHFAMLELLQDYVGEMKRFQDLAHFLDACSSKSMLSKHWVDNLFKPFMLIMMYVRSERQGDFSLHLHPCYKMMPYFFVTGHVNYVRYGLCYLRTIRKLPGIVLEQFLKDEYVVRYHDEHWNRIWTNIMIESAYMRHGEGAGGIIGTTTKPRSVKIWSNSLPSFNDVLRDLDKLRGRYSTQKIIHKEEPEARVIADMKDRNALQITLQLCAHPFEMTSHDPSVFMNIYTSEISPDKRNVLKSVEIRNKQMKEFQ